MSKKSIAFARPAPKSENADEWVKSKSRDPSETTKRFTIDVPETLHRRVKIRCAERGQKMSDVVRNLLEQQFPEQESTNA